MRARRWITPVLVLGLLAAPSMAVGQEATERVMIAAGQWAAERLPDGSVRVDPHRTGDRGDQSLARNMARSLGAELGTLEQMRQCDDPLDVSTCVLECDVLLAVAMPDIDGDRATVRLYAWHRQDDAQAPVGKTSWDVRLRSVDGAWQVVGADRRP